MPRPGSAAGDIRATGVSNLIASFVGYLDQRTTRQYIQSMKANLPASPGEWLREIARAYLDAKEAQPFGKIRGEPIAESDLFHLAPHVFLKFRGLRPSQRRRTEIVERALASYVLTMDEGAGRAELRDSLQLSFAFCYLAAHSNAKPINWKRH